MFEKVLFTVIGNKQGHLPVLHPIVQDPEQDVITDEFRDTFASQIIQEETVRILDPIDQSIDPFGTCRITGLQIVEEAGCLDIGDSLPLLDQGIRQSRAVVGLPRSDASGDEESLRPFPVIDIEQFRKQLTLIRFRNDIEQVQIQELLRDIAIDIQISQLSAPMDKTSVAAAFDLFDQYAVIF